MAGQIPSNFGIRKTRGWKWVGAVALIFSLASAVLLVRMCSKERPSLQFWSVSFSPDGASVVTGGGRTPAPAPNPGELVFWNIANGRKMVVPEKASIRSVAWFPDGKSVAVGDLGGTTKLVSSETGKTLLNFSPPANQVNAVSVSSSGNLVAAATFDGTIDLWDAAGKEQHLFVKASERFLDVAIAPNDLALIATARSGNAFLYNLATCGEPAVIQAYNGPPKRDPTAECAAFSGDGLAFATGSLTTLRIWETQTGALLQDINCSANVNNIAFAPGGSMVATVHADGSLSLWNRRTGKNLRTVQAHPDEAFGLSFARDGQRIATVSRNDYVIKIWDANTLKLVASLQRPKPEGLQ